MAGERLGMSVAALQETAATIRCDVIEMICAAGEGHPGGSLSVTDLITALYFRISPSIHRIRTGPTATALSSPRATPARPGTRPWRNAAISTALTLAPCASSTACCRDTRT